MRWFENIIKAVLRMNPIPAIRTASQEHLDKFAMMPGKTFETDDEARAFFKYEEEKRLVADFMQYEIIDDFHVKDKDGNYITDGIEWNPRSERKWWPKMFQMLADKELVQDFIAALEVELMSMPTPANEELTPASDIAWVYLTVGEKYLWLAAVRILVCI